MEKNRLPFISLAILIALLPFISAGKPFFLLSRISLVALIISWLTEVVVKKEIYWREVINNSLLISFFLFYFFVLIGIFYSSNTEAAFSLAEKLFPLLIFPLVILTSNSLSRISAERLLWTFAFSVTLACLCCIGYAFHRNNYWEFFLSPNWFYFSYSDLTEVIGIQPIYLAFYVEFALLIGLVYLLKNWSFVTVRIRVSVIVLVSFLFFTLFLLAGKMSILSSTVGVAILLFYFFFRAKRIWIGVIGVVLIVIISVVIVPQLPIVKERFLSLIGMDKTSEWVYGDPSQSKPSTEARLVKWKASWNIIVENWLFGVGSGDVQDELNKEFDRLDFQLGAQESFNSHNQFLQTWLTTGLFGLLSVLVTLFLALKIAFSEGDILLFILCFIFVANCLTESILERQYGIFFYSIFLPLVFRFRLFTKDLNPHISI